MNMKELINSRSLKQFKNGLTVNAALCCDPNSNLNLILNLRLSYAMHDFRISIEIYV